MARYPTYLPTDFVKQDDKARFKSYLDGFQPLGSDYEPTKAAPDLFTEAARIAREKGYDDDAGRVVQAILRTEGALSGEVGDKDLPGAGSFGPLQFYRKYGMLPSYAKSLGVSEDDAAEHARKNPTHAIDWALGGYLGNAIREGQAKGLRGAELATYAQQHGQRSQAPERAGQNYSAMFGGGAPIPAHAPTTVGPREAAIPAHTPVDDRAEFGKYLSSFPELGSDLQMGKERAIPAHEPKDDKQAFGEFLDSFPKLGADYVPFQPEGERQGALQQAQQATQGAVQNLGKVVEPLGEAMNWYGKNVQGPQMEAIHRAGLESGASESLGEPFAVRRGMAAQPLATLLPTAVRDISESGGLPEWWKNLTETYEQRPEDFPGQKGVAELAVPSEIVANVITEPAAIGRAAKGVVQAAGKALPEAGRLGRALAGEAGEQLLERTPMRTMAGDLGEAIPEPPRAGESPIRPLAEQAAETSAEEGLQEAVGQMGPPTAGNAANRTLLEMYTKGPSGESGQGAWDRLELARRAFVRATTDRDVDLAQFQKAAQKAKGTPLSADEMAYELNRLNPDKSAEVAIQDSLKPAIQAAGDDRAWLSVYLTHLDNIDVARAMGQKVERELGAAAGAKAARERKFSGGLDVAASRQALADMTQELGPERMQKIEVAAQQVQEFVKGRRDRLAEAGVISTELRDALAEMYPNYVPTRILDYMQEPVNIARGKSLSLSDTGLRRNTIEGTVREREDPLASLVRLAYQSEATARKNEAFNAFVKLREMMPDVQDKIREVADNYVVRRNEAKVTGFVEGKRVTYAMPKELEAVIKAEPGAVIPGLVGHVWGTLMHGFRAAATSRFPLFLATNALLDAATYATRASIREGGPQHLPRVLIELGRSYGDAFSGLFTREYHGTTAEFLRRGGGQFGFFQGTPGATRRTVQDLSRKHIFEIQSAKDIARLTRDLVTFKPVEAIGERIELAPRVAMYNLASRRTNTVKAVIEGRTVTIDFSQGGNISKLLNQFIPFFNVGMQALVQPVRAFAENPRAFVASVGTLIIGPTIAAEAWNRADPQRAKDYDDVPDYIKDQGVVIMLPIEAPIDSRGNRRPQFFLIRMREFAPFAIAAREAANRAMGGEAREWQDLIGSGVMSVSPVQGNSLGDVVAGFSPLGVSTGGQLAANYDYFRGRMIATKGGDERASEVSKVLANALGVRPSQVEFAIRDLTAGLGGTALAAGQLVAGKTEATGAIQDMPVVGGLAGRFVKSGIGGNLDRAQARLITPQGKQILKDNSIDLSIGPVGNTIEGVPLNVEEQTMYQELTNQYLDEALREIIKLPKWAEYDMDVRADIARGAVDGARDGAGAEVFKKMGNEEIRRRLAKIQAGGQ